MESKTAAWLLTPQQAGPIKPPQKSRYVELLSKKAEEKPISDNEDADDGADEDDEELSELDEELDDEASVSEGDEDDESESDNASDASSGDEEDEAAEVLEAVVDHGTSAQEDGRKRKRRQRDEYDNLESKYLDRLADEEEPTGKRLKGGEAPTGEAMDTSPDGDADSNADSSSEDVVPVHESLSADPAVTDLEKANRTVFLSNVSAEAVTSRHAKKTLLNHLSSILDKKASPPQKIESIRFRSTAFSTAAIPKRAAYIKKSVMEATTKSTNAYVVYSSTPAARLAVAELNGTTVLDRHLRVDSVAHPAAIDHRRCVFVGNLGFVDDESVLNTKVDEDGKEVTEKKKRTKVPMDVEEGLWRVFSKEAGKVESVRVVRDPITRVGKGFAYVQFYDGNAVESAVLLNEKKFPPMLPRTLRVSRCKAPHKTARAMEAKQGAKNEKTLPPNGKGKGKADKGSGYVPKVTAEDKTLAGRAGKLLGRSAASQLGGKKKKWDKANAGARRRESNGAGAGATEADGKKIKSPEDIVFEGRRASVKDGRPKDLKFKGGGKHKKKGGPKSGGRGAIRAAQWRAGGGAAK
ncbi:hypothetical protein B0T16DRAFT_401307 [Cercophora newfieldiana]|uniref:Nucleolar protein 12 n=1 Tax=Cercophora newfieldiana TaxID=92897 RepID=A0AA39YTR2_9PEZI|nr:hypothetical protein B0T16DRAFT_401307 [Cercophora newfieldiana]